jgi:hypothetical protein
MTWQMWCLFAFDCVIALIVIAGLALACLYVWRKDQEGCGG